MVVSNNRHVSQLTRDTLTFILAGGKGSRLCELTQYQSKPATHFGGKFRIIDFPLSNCVNSGMRKIAVLTQYKAYTLIKHLSRGWSHLNRDLGEFIEVLPASQQYSSNWYAGTADAIYQNIDFIKEYAPKYVAVLAGDHIYKMDYGDMLLQHEINQSDMTVSCLELPTEVAAKRFGVVTVDENNKIIQFDEKPRRPNPMPGNPNMALASMGNYIFKTEYLIDLLCDDAINPHSLHDFGHDIIPRCIKHSNVHAFRFKDKQGKVTPYWRDVGTLDAFWQANMDLVDVSPELNIYDEEWPILTHQKQSPPAKFVFNQDNRRGYAVDSMVSGGCIVSGSKIVKSLLFSDVRVGSFSCVEDSVVLPNVVVGRHVKIKRAIIDADCIIPDRMEIGIDRERDLARGFRVSQEGVVLVTNDMLKKLKTKTEIGSRYRRFMKSYYCA